MKRIVFILFLTIAFQGFAQDQVRENALAFSRGLECKYREDTEGAIRYFEEALAAMPTDAASMYELSQQYVQAGRIEEGFAMSRQAAALDPDNKWYQKRLALFYRNLGQLEEFAAIYEDLVEKNPDDLDLLSELLEVYLATENYDKALEKLDQLERQAGANELIGEQRLEIYKRQGNTTKLISELQAMIAANPENTRHYHRLAQVYMENNRDREAFELYNRIKEIDPDDQYVHISLLEYYEKQNNVDAAFDELIAVIRNRNLDFNTKTNIYEYWFRKYPYSEKIAQQALMSGNAFVETYPDQSVGYLVLAWYYWTINDFVPCEAMSLKAIEFDPSNYSVWQYLLTSESSLQKFDSLAKHSMEAIQYFPTQPMLYWYAGASLAFSHRDEEAITYLERGRRFVTEPQWLADFDNYLGDVYYSVGRVEESFAAYDRVLRVQPDHALVLNNYAYYLSLRQERLDEAKAMAQRAVELEPDNATYFDTYAWVLYQRGEYAAAEVQMRKSIQLLAAPDKNLYEHFADILEKVGKTGEAQEYRNRANAL